MKKKIIWLITCTSLILLIGGSILFLLKDSPKYGVLIINGDDVTQENVIIHSNYADVPLTEVLKSFDMNVEWVDNNIAEITFKDKKYTLNLSEVSLIEVGDNINLLLPPPGGNRSYTVLEKEIILDSDTIKGTMYLMGIRINIDINRKDKTVYIIERID